MAGLLRSILEKVGIRKPVQPRRRLTPEGRDALVASIRRVQSAASEMVEARRSLNRIIETTPKGQNTEANLAMDQAADDWNREVSAMEEQAQIADVETEGLVAEFKANLFKLLIPAHKLPSDDPVFHNEAASLAEDMVEWLDSRVEKGYHSQ